MLKQIAIAATAAFIGLSGVQTSDAEAGYRHRGHGHHYGFSGHRQHYGYGYGYRHGGHYGGHYGTSDYCSWKKVYEHGYWKWAKVCWR